MKEFFRRSKKTAEKNEAAEMKKDEVVEAEKTEITETEKTEAAGGEDLVAHYLRPDRGTDATSGQEDMPIYRKSGFDLKNEITRKALAAFYQIYVVQSHGVSSLLSGEVEECLGSLSEEQIDRLSEECVGYLKSIDPQEDMGNSEEFFEAMKKQAENWDFATTFGEELRQDFLRSLDILKREMLPRFSDPFVFVVQRYQPELFAWRLKLNLDKIEETAKILIRLEEEAR